MRPNFQGAMSPMPPRAYAQPSVANDRPAYRILKECFLDDIMFFPDQLVYWDEEPNQEMEPLNELARDAHNKFLDKIEEAGQRASAAKGMLYVALKRPEGEARAMSTSESRRVEIIKGDGGVPVMGARKRGRPKAQRIEDTGVEEKPIADLTRK